jgi:hypothetical protein
MLLLPEGQSDKAWGTSNDAILFRTSEEHCVESTVTLLVRRVHKIAKSDYQLRHFCLSARPSA